MTKTPAPETTGLKFAIVGLVSMLTVLVDVLAVGLRAPALAGLPAMSIYLISAANTTEGLPARYFLAAATCWLLMVGVTARDDVDEYSAQSQELAAKAWDEGRFAKSVVPVKDQNGLVVLDNDEHRRPGTTAAHRPTNSARQGSA